MGEVQHQELGRPVFFGFLVIGFLSLLGGIAMFAFVVPKDMNADGPPRDVNILFTNVYAQQIIMHNERSRYAAALSEVGIDSATCNRYSCRLTVDPSGKGYVFRLAKNGRTWAIEAGHPVPKEVP